MTTDPLTTPAFFHIGLRTSDLDTLDRAEQLFRQVFDLSADDALACLYRATSPEGVVFIAQPAHLAALVLSGIGFQFHRCGYYAP